MKTLSDRRLLSFFAFSSLSLPVSLTKSCPKESLLLSLDHRKRPSFSWLSSFWNKRAYRV